MLTEERRTPADILAEWRTAEHELARCVEGSPDQEEIVARVCALAHAYHEATEGGAGGLGTFGPVLSAGGPIRLTMSQT